MLVLLLLIAPLIIWIYVMTAGATEFHRGGCIGRLHDYLNEQVWADLYRLGCRILGRTLSDRLAGVSNYLLTKAHPLVQIFYLILYIGSIGIFFSAVWPLLPGRYLSPMHINVAVPAVIVLTFVAFLVASFSDPGRIGAGNVDRVLEVFDYDYVLFRPKMCTTCNMIKPARSKHCSLCGICVAKADHHCPWVNNCIGHRNFRYFLFYLTMNAWICAHGAYIMYWALEGEMARLVEEGVVLDGSGGVSSIASVAGGAQRRLRVDRDTAYMLVIAHHTFAAALGLFCALAGALVAAFLAYQLNTVRGSTTANEAFKLADLGHLHKAYGYVIVGQNDADRQLLVQHYGEERATTVLAKRPLVGDEHMQPDIRRLPNIYGRSFTQNMRDILWPVDIGDPGEGRVHGDDTSASTSVATSRAESPESIVHQRGSGSDTNRKDKRNINKQHTKKKNKTSMKKDDKSK